MKKGIDVSSAITLREILLRDIDLSRASEDVQEALDKEKIQTSEDTKTRILSVLENVKIIENSFVLDELSEYFSKVIDDGRYVSQLVSASATLSNELNVELSEESIKFLSGIDVKSMLDEETLSSIKEHLVDRDFSFDSETILDHYDGPRIPFPRLLPNQPPIQIDPYGPYAGIGSASVIIAVAIGVILAKNVDRTVGDRVLDYSGLERL